MREGIVRELVMDMYILYLKWITNKDLLYGTWNSVLLGSLPGKGVWGRMDTCICMAESLCCPHETITKLLISNMPIQNKFFLMCRFLCIKYTSVKLGEKRTEQN